MYLMGGLDRDIGRYIGRYVGRYLVEYRSSIGRITRSRYRLTVGRVSVEYRPCVDDLHVGRYVCQPIWL